MNSPVVVNTGPIIALGVCGQTELLHALHSRVIVPEAVLTELAPGGPIALPTGLDLTTYPWLEVVPSSTPIPPGLLLTLDAGEASVNALALELGVSLVLIDERRGGQVARERRSRSKSVITDCSMS